MGVGVTAANKSQGTVAEENVVERRYERYKHPNVGAYQHRA